MQPFKEIYLEVEDWYKQQNPDKIISILQSDRNFNNKLDIEKLRRIIQWYVTIRDHDDVSRSYLLGDNVPTIEDISNYMLKYLEDQHYGPSENEDEDEWTQDERDSGYGGYSDYLEIVSFWKNLDGNGILSILEGSTLDHYEIDLDNGRCYFLSHSKVHSLIFSHAYYNLPEFIKEIGAANSNDFSDFLQNYLPPEIFLPNISSFNKIYNEMSIKKIKSEIERFNSMVKDVVKQFKDHQIDDLKQRALEIEKYLIN